MEIDARCAGCTLLVCACELCNTQFNTDEALPRVLTCGHSFCAPCIKKLIEKTPKEKNRKTQCPNCLEFITQGIDSYPINYMLLTVCKVFLSAEHLLRGEPCRFHDLKKKLSSKEDILTPYLNAVQEMTKKLELLIKDPKGPSQEVLNEIEQQYHKLDHAKNPSKKEPVPINFTNFEASVDEIIIKLQNEENVFIHEIVEKSSRYGRVSIENNMILFHALSLPLTEIPENSSIIELDAVEDSFNIHKFGIFFKLSCNQKGVTRLVILELFETNVLSLFLKLCTGHYGSSYKDCSFEAGDSYVYHREIANIEPCAQSYMEAYGDTVCHFLSKDPIYEKSEMVVQWSENSRLKICQVVVAMNLKTAIARVKSPLNLSKLLKYPENEDTKLKVIDCGVVYTY